MWSVSPWTLFVSLLLLGTGFGCASAKPFQAVQPIPTGKGIVYVYEGAPGHLGFNAVLIEVFMKNNVVGCLQGNDYLAFQCAPGPVAVSTGFMVPGEAITADSMSSVTLNVEPGGQYYVKVEYSAPAFQNARITPTVVPEQDALAQIKDCTAGQPHLSLAATLSGNVNPGVDLKSFKSVYVIDDKDDSTTAPLVADRLRAQGYVVRTGLAENMPADTQCLVKIQEQWFWDLTTYLLQLQIELRNPQTQASYAYGTVRRVQPRGRRPAEIMSTEVVNAIFNGGMPEGVDVAPETAQP